MHLVSYCILISFISAVLDGLIFFMSCKVFGDRLTSYITAHKHMILEHYSAKNHKVAAVFVLLITFLSLIAKGWSGICLTCWTGCNTLSMSMGQWVIHINTFDLLSTLIRITVTCKQTCHERPLTQRLIERKQCT